MGYVEWLRVRGCLKWAAIVLGAVFLMALAVRVVVIGNHDYVSWALSTKSDPGAKETESTLPGGTRRITIDDPAKQLYIVFEDRGSQGKHIEIYDRSAGGSSGPGHAANMGSVRVSKLPGHGTVTVVDTNGQTDFITYLVNGVIVAFIVATVLGAPFAREGDGHLEIALTKPVSRERLAATVLAIDAAGVAAAFVLGVLFGIAVHAIFELPHIAFNVADLLAAIAGVLAPIAWYSMLTAATASLRRGYGAVLGFAWPAAAIVLALSYASPDGNAALTAAHDIAWVLNLFNPLAHVNLHHGNLQIGGPPVFGMGYGNQIVALALLTALYAAVSLVQWRRAQA